MLCVATTFALSWHKQAPPSKLYPGPSSPSNVRFYWYDHPADSSRVRLRAPTEIKAYYKQNELGGAARAHGQVESNMWLIPI